MQDDPGREWLRLTRLYAEKTDDELLELAADFRNLTEIAQGVLRDELKKRALGDPPTPVALHRETSPGFGGWSGDSKTAAETIHGGGQGEPVEYTCKAVLCDCDDWDQAWNISDALRREGIESWTEGPHSSFEIGLIHPRVLVPADRLDDARTVASSPIPQEIIDLHKDFVPPRCPKCGAGDPLLESVEPVNTWRCENCGARWSDAAAVENEVQNPA